MLNKGEWEPDERQPVGSWPSHIIVRAHCAKCGHSADVDVRRIERLPKAMPAADLVKRLSCNFCPQGKGTGRVAIYLRKKPRN